ncbi:unnamed protein product, partial [marine sediment metagenome]
YSWGDIFTDGDAVRYARGGHVAGFDEWSVHRGNVTSGVWTNNYGIGYNLSFVLWGDNMNVSSYVSSSTDSTANTTFKTITYINDFDT